MQLSGSGGPCGAAALPRLHLLRLLLLLLQLVLRAPASAGSPSAPSAPSAPAAPAEPADASAGKESRGLFSPRMDYDEWTPLGRGDPLKNDPTYDYVPPVLERVHYWIEPSSRTPDPLLPSAPAAAQHPASAPPAHEHGSAPADAAPAPASGPAPATAPADARLDVFDPFLKFVDGPKFSSPHHQHFYNHHVHHRVPPSVDGAQHRKPLPASAYYTSQGYRPQANPNPNAPSAASLDAHTYLAANKPATTTLGSTLTVDVGEHGGHPQPPNTMLVPPPVQEEAGYAAQAYRDGPPAGHEHTGAATAPPHPHAHDAGTPTQASVTVEEANLIYHTTKPEWEAGKTQLATVAQASNYVTWETPTSLPVTDIKHSNHPYIENQVLIAVKGDKETSEGQVGFLQSLLQNERVQSQDHVTTTLATTANSVEMTSSSSLTTDPLFSHYKQPAEPLRGPMYLIIQGHSKVKTYGANKNQNFHGIPIQISNEIQYQAGEGNDTERLGREYGLNNQEGTKWFSEDTNDTTEARVPQENVNSSSTDKNETNSKSTNPEPESRTNALHAKEMASSSNEIQESTEQGLFDASKEGRRKRQVSLEDFIPIDDDTAEELLHDFLVDQGQGSGLGAIVASSLVNLGRQQSEQTEHLEEQDVDNFV